MKISLPRLIIHALLLLAPTLAMAQVCSRDLTPPTTPTNRFSFTLSGHAVLDNYTGKTWLRCAMGYRWDSGLNTCVFIDDVNPDIEQRLFTWGEALTTGVATATSQRAELSAYSDWRLPTIKELTGILDLQCISPPMNLDVFPATPASANRGYWTATPHLTEYGNNTPSAWYIDLMSGKTAIKRLFSTTGTEDTKNFVILVRP